MVSKPCFQLGKAPYEGLTRVYAQHLMESMAHDLYYTFGMIMICL
ncbi:MAG: hypothetical protein ACMUEL_01815 [Flavobacteriales bacterium Tduv]